MVAPTPAGLKLRISLFFVGLGECVQEIVDKLIRVLDTQRHSDEVVGDADLGSLGRRHTRV